jgi:hypothetical protein
MPILGIMASAISGNLGPVYNESDYESIQTVTLTSNQSSISFTSIPGTYKHLQVRGIARSSEAQPVTQCKLQFNSDTGSNYTFHALFGNGSSAASEGYGTGVVNGVTPVLRIPAATAASSLFGLTVIDILDYANTNKYKTVRSLNGYDSNGSGQVNLTSGLWTSTSAVTSIQITHQAGSAEFVQYSSLALYGIKG